MFAGTQTTIVAIHLCLARFVIAAEHWPIVSQIVTMATAKEAIIAAVDS